MGMKIKDLKGHIKVCSADTPLQIVLYTPDDVQLTAIVNGAEHKGAALVLHTNINRAVTERFISEQLLADAVNEAKVPTPYVSPCVTANKLVNGDRGGAYGPPHEDFGATAVYWSQYMKRKYSVDIKLQAEDVAMFMILQKVNRESFRHKDDNLIDIAGYSETAAKVHYHERSSSKV